jgi:hypothetical protein
LGVRLIHDDLMLLGLLTRKAWKTHVQYAIGVFGRDLLCIDGLIKGKNPFKASAAIFPQNPFGPGKSFWRKIRDGQLITFYVEVKMFPDPSRGKNEHFKAVFRFINVHSGPLHGAVVQVLVPASVVAFCGIRLIVVHVFFF